MSDKVQDGVSLSPLHQCIGRAIALTPASGSAFATVMALAWALAKCSSFMVKISCDGPWTWTDLIAYYYLLLNLLTLFHSQ